MEVSELQAIELIEARDRRRRRGYCGSCAHTWKPRNPSPRVNRCPSCGVRGQVRYDVLDDKPQRVGAGAEAK